LTDGRTEEFIAYKGKDGNYSIKIGDNIYTAIEGIIQLPNFLTEHQSLEDYTTKAYVAAEIAKAATEGKVDLTGYATETYVDQKTAALVDSAPETLNTLNELAVAINNHEDAYDALLETVGNKAEKEHTHEQYLTEHQSLEGYAKKTDLFSKSYNDLTDKPAIPSIEGLATEKYVDDAIAAIQEPVEEVKSTLTTTVLPKVNKVDEIEPTVGELKAWVDNKNYLQDIDLSKVEEDLRVLENNIGYVKVDDKSFAEVIDETFAKKTDIPTKVSELENDANYTNETKVLELIENNASAKIGIDFVTDITVGHLKSGTFISKDKTLQEILYNILVCNHD
jgi:hypothetical protein